MIHPPYWDNQTFIFYLAVGIICALIIGLHFGTIHIGISKDKLQYNYKKFWEGYFPLILILIFFAGLRKVGPGLGGTDSLSYERDFLNSLNGLGSFENTDVLYGQYSLYLRHLTSSPLVFRFVSYSFIAFCLVYFIKEICPSKISWIPFILIVWPYICGFSSMRSSMAIGFIQLGLVALFKKRYLLEWMCIIACVLFHRMMFFFVPMFLVFHPISKLIIKCNKVQLFLLIGISILIISWLALEIQKYVMLYGLMIETSSPTASYMVKSADTNLFESWPMFIQQIFLLIFLFINFKKFTNPKEQFVLVLSCFDAVLTFPALILGIYRISQCLYVPTLMLWGVLLYNFCHKYTWHIRPIIDFVFLLGFTFIFYCRLQSMYESSSLMPYILFWN